MLIGIWGGMGSLIVQQVLVEEQFRAVKFCRRTYSPSKPIGIMLQNQPRDVDIHASFTQQFPKRFSLSRFGLSLLAFGMASISMNLADYAAMTFYANGGMEKISAFKAQIGLTPTMGATTGCTDMCGC